MELKLSLGELYFGRRECRDFFFQLSFDKDKGELEEDDGER